MQKQNPVKFIPYDGPPERKQTSRRNPAKVPSSEGGPRSNTEQRNKEDLAPTSHGAGVEVTDLTYSAGEGNCGIGGNGGGGSGDVGSDDVFPPKNGRESLGFKQIVSMRTSQEDTRTGDGSLDQPAPSEGSSQEGAVVIEDSQSDSDTDEGGPHEDDTGMQIGDHLEASSISTLEYCRKECPTDAKDAIDLETVDGAKTQASGLPRRELPSTPLTGSSMMDIEPLAQEASGHTLPRATTHQSQQPMQKKVEREGKSPTIRNTGSSSSGSDTDDDDHSGNHTTSLTCKRKRSPPTKRHSRTLKTTSKQRSKHATNSARQRKLSPIRGRPLSDRPSALKLPSAEGYGGYDGNTCYSDDSSDESSNDSSDGSNEDRARHLGSNKPPMSTVRPSRSHRHKKKRNRTADEDDEYEVEKILDARVNRRKLQYRVKWFGYEEDMEWYVASNFKNSPHKLREFHTANPTRPGPPERLESWVQCWEEDRDADDHPDDNKPKRSHTGGGML